jgi:hypothetical protein
VVLAKVKAALPLWQAVHIDSQFNDISIEGAEGSGKAARYEEHQALTGVVKDSGYQTSIDITGLSVASPLLPPQAVSMVPEKVGFAAKASGIDLETAANTVFNNPNPSKDDVQGALLGILFGGQAKVSADMKVAASAYDLAGHAEAPIDLKMQGTGTFSMRGFDEVVAAIRSLDQPDANNAALGMALIKGLGKSGPDGRLVWDVAVDGIAKKFTVNGQTFDLPEK